LHSLLGHTIILNRIALFILTFILSADRNARSLSVGRGVVDDVISQGWARHASTDIRFLKRKDENNLVRVFLSLKVYIHNVE